MEPSRAAIECSMVGHLGKLEWHPRSQVLTCDHCGTVLVGVDSTMKQLFSVLSKR